MRAFFRRIVKTTDRKRGQSLVELALTLPIVLFLMMGIVDLGFVLYAHVQVASATGEASRFAAHYTGDTSLSRSDNDALRLVLVKKAVYDSEVTAEHPVVTSALGRLNPSSPFFSIGDYRPNHVDPYLYPPTLTDDVWIDGYDASNPGGVTRSGEEVVVHVRYHQRVLFGILPGLDTLRFTQTNTTTVRIP